jgi:hypothetical protein
VPDLVGEAPRDNREHAPKDAEDTGQPADLAFRQAEIGGHRRKQRSDDPPVEADEAEADAEQRDGLPLVRRIPAGGA